LKITGGSERIIFATVLFVIVGIVISCLWITVAKLDEDQNNWISSNDDFR